LALAGVKSLLLSIDSKFLNIDIELSDLKQESEVAWAVAALISPALLPTASQSLDVTFEATADSVDLAALAMGHTIHHEAFAGSDASEMESSHARRVQPADVESVYFDVATFSPIGLRIRETAAKPIIANISLDDFLVIDGTKFLADEHAAAHLHKFTGAIIHSYKDLPQNAGLLAGIAATGVVLHSAVTPSHLNESLRALLATPLPTGDSLEWMIRSEQQRRLALLHHGGNLRLQDSWPLTSALLVTNRIGMLHNAVSQIVQQTYPSVEILVGLHGIELASGKAAVADHISEFGDRIKLFEIPQSTPLGAAYGQLTAVSDGEYIAKFDDDDFYGPHHLWDAILSLKYSGAGLFGRTPTMTWLSASSELLLRPFGPEEIFNKYIIGATMVMNKAALVQAGGWRPSPWAVDKALIDRFTSAGIGVYRASQLGWVYVRHNQGHTWVRDESHFRGQAERVWTGEEAIRIRDAVIRGDFHLGTDKS